jgi:hypothetical protein
MKHFISNVKQMQPEFLPFLLGITILGLFFLQWLIAY